MLPGDAATIPAYPNTAGMRDEKALYRTTIGNMNGERPKIFGLCERPNPDGDPIG